MSLPPEASSVVRPRVRRRLPAVMMRSGTSKGLFLHRQDLPTSELEWGPILTSAMGSRNGDVRQLDGMGGGSSVTSKVAVVSKSTRPGIDVDYTFVQVAVGQEKIDMSGNCGNMSSGVGPFAVDEGLVKVERGKDEIDVRIFNTNTQRVLVETVKVGPDGHFDDEGDFLIGGVRNPGSQIKVAFQDPAGSMTGKLFPTGERQEWLDIEASTQFPAFSVRATLIDASNPFIFVDSATLPATYLEAGPAALSSLDIIESIRRHGAVRMGLAENIEIAALTRGTPKIAILSHPDPVTTLSAPLVSAKGQLPDIAVVAYSMGKLHPSLQLTGAVCLGAALTLPGTVAADLRRKGKKNIGQLTPPSTPPDESMINEDIEDRQENVVISHPIGNIEATVEVVGGQKVKSVGVFRTARRIFEGNIVITL